MERKELTQEQIEKITAGSDIDRNDLIIIYHILVDYPLLGKDADALAAKAAAAGVTLPTAKIAEVGSAIAALI